MRVCVCVCMYPFAFVCTSIQTGEYIVGWSAKVTPLGYKLISLNAAMNGLSKLEQVSV